MALQFGNAPKKRGNTPVSKEAIQQVVAEQLASHKAKHQQRVSNSDATRKGLLKGEETNYDQHTDDSIRPQHLTDYIGQSSLKDSLNIALKAAKSRQEAMDHILLYGPPGLGKTTLAMAMAREMDASFHLTSAPALERPRDIVGLLMGLTEGSVLFIDEIHRLNKVTEEILYPAMEDYRLDRTVGKGPSAKLLSVPLPRFTLIGATTKAGSIANPLRDRFGMMCRLNFYEQPELEAILHRSAGILDIELASEGAAAIASRSRGTPRIANRLLRRVRDYVMVTSETSAPEPITGQQACDALDMFDIDPMGLDITDRKLLMLMIERFNGGPVGLETMAAALGEDARTIEDVYEPYLLQAGFLQRTPRGRCVTAHCLNHLGLGHLGLEGSLPTLQQQLL